LEIELSEEERRFLQQGVNQCLGPSSPTEELAIALRFEGLEDLCSHCVTFRQALELQEPMEALDWARTMAVTEFVFASDTFGAGLDWPCVTPFTDEESVRILRTLQKRFLKKGATFNQAR